MADSATNIIRIEWEPPSLIPFSALDAAVFGHIFSFDLPDPNIDYYEVERLNEDESIYVSVGMTYIPQIEFTADIYDNARVRIRSVLRDGTKTPWAYSGNFPLYGMRADFGNTNNTLLLSFI